MESRCEYFLVWLVWVFDQAAEDQKAGFKHFADLLLNYFVHEVEHRASVGHTQAHQGAFAAFVKDETEVVYQIQNWLGGCLSFGAGTGILFELGFVLLLLVNFGLDKTQKLIVVQENSFNKRVSYIRSFK